MATGPVISGRAEACAGHCCPLGDIGVEVPMQSAAVRLLGSQLWL